MQGVAAPAQPGQDFLDPQTLEEAPKPSRRLEDRHARIHAAGSLGLPGACTLSARAGATDVCFLCAHPKGSWSFQRITG